MLAGLASPVLIVNLPHVETPAVSDGVSLSAGGPIADSAQFSHDRRIGEVVARLIVSVAS